MKLEKFLRSSQVKMNRDFSCLLSGNENSFRPISRESSYNRESPRLTPSPTFKRSPRLNASTPTNVHCDLKLNYTCPMCKKSTKNGDFKFPLRWYVSSIPYIREGFCSSQCMIDFEILRENLTDSMNNISHDTVEWSTYMGRVLYESQIRGFKVCFSRYNRERKTCANILTPKESYKGYCKSCDLSCDTCKEPRRSCACCHECKKRINSPECCYYQDIFQEMEI